MAWKNLVPEDVRALDYFETQVVQGGAGAFYLPNLLPNGSFENPALSSGDIAAGWTVVPGATGGIGVSTTASDGVVALEFTGTQQLVSDWTPSVDIGDVYLYSAQVSGGVLGLQVIVSYSDGTTQTITAVLSGGAGYAANFGSFTIAASGTATAATMQTAFVSSGATGVLLDSVSLALISAAKPYGRMPGNASIGRPVRLSKPFSIKDGKPANGSKRYDVACEVMEL